MITMDSLVQTLLEVLEAFNRNDLALIAERVDPEVTYVIPGRAAVSGEFHGVEEVTRAFRRLRERSGDSISVEPQTVLADEETVLFVARVTADHDGRHLDVTNAYRYRFRGGRLIEGRLFPGDMAAIEAFFV